MREIDASDVTRAFGRWQEIVLTEGPVLVTRYGRPSVVIVSYEEHAALVEDRPGVKAARERRARGLPPSELRRRPRPAR